MSEHRDHSAYTEFTVRARIVAVVPVAHTIRRATVDNSVSVACVKVDFSQVQVITD